MRPKRPPAHHETNTRKTETKQRFGKRTGTFIKEKAIIVMAKTFARTHEGFERVGRMEKQTGKDFFNHQRTASYIHWKNS